MASESKEHKRERLYGDTSHSGDLETLFPARLACQLTDSVEISVFFLFGVT